MSGIKAASIQMDCKSNNIKENLAKAECLLTRAKEQGAGFAVLPELFNVGYKLEEFKELDYDFNGTLNTLKRISKELGIHIIAGVLEKSDGQYYNTAVIFDNSGEMIEKYRKINLFPLSNEKEIFVPGNRIKTVNIGGIKLGILICYDIRFPELSRKYFNNGCSAYAVLSAFPFPRLDHWNIIIKARAIENQSYVIASNRVGSDGNMKFVGNSCIIDPWGKVLGILNDTQEDVLVQDIDLNEVAGVRELIPCNKDKIWLEAVLRQEEPAFAGNKAIE